MSTILRNISGKILITVFGAFLILSAYFIYNSYQTHINVAERQTLERLYSISKTLAAQVSGDDLQMILDTFPEKDDITESTQDNYYHKQREILQRAKELNDLKTPIYTLHYDSTKGNFFIGISTSDPLWYRHPYDTHPEELIENYHGGGIIPEFTDAHGSWLSAVYPVRNNAGNVVGVVEVDMPFDEFYAKAKNSLYRNIAFTLIVFLIVGGILYKLIRDILRQEERSKNELQRSNRIIENKNEELAQKNMDIMDSLNYASRIQQAIIPQENTIQHHFKDAFVFYRPKDYVSGDFYWFKHLSNNEMLLAVIDCTGHGVPGAFMSVIGHSLLNDIVVNKNITEPALVLEKLNKGVIEFLQQSGNNSSGTSDGMDVSLCKITPDKNEIAFAGAFHQIIVMNSKLEIVQGDRQPIGGTHYDLDRKFTNHIINYENGDWLYLFSDGFPDQFGGPKNKKFKMRRFKQMIENNHQSPAKEQKSKMKRAFEEWKGKQEQIDDVTLLGIRL